MKMTQEKQQSWFRKHWILTIIIVLVVLGIIGAAFSPESQDSNKTGTTSQSESKQYTNEDLENLIFDFVSGDSTLTDIQKEEQFKQYKNKWIKGTGIVKDIDTVMMSDSIVVSIIRYDNQYLRGATIYFDSSQKDKLMDISVYDEISFDGRIETYNSLGGIIIKEAVVKN